MTFMYINIYIYIKGMACCRLGHAQTASNGMQFGSRPNSRDAYPSRPSTTNQA